MDNQKPHITEVLEILMLREQASKIYKEIDLRIEKLRDKHGSGIRFDFDLSFVPLCEYRVERFAFDLLQKGKFLKFEITDNADKLFNDETVFKTTSIKRFTFSSGSLKRMPESLKEEKRIKRRKLLKNHNEENKS